MQNSQNTTLKVLSYNVQVGIGATSLADNLCNAWRHALPATKTLNTLASIAELVQDFDLVALQEIDTGSLRTRHVNQLQHIQHHTQFRHRTESTTRKIGPFTTHAKGMLSHYAFQHITHAALPGRIKGRGITLVELGLGQHKACIVNVHLALSKRAQLSQLDTISQLIKPYKTVILMGDFNMSLTTLAQTGFLRQHNLRATNTENLSYPSWQPKKLIDFILISDDIGIQSSHTIDCPFSDHLPVAAELMLPHTIQLTDLDKIA